MAVIPKDQFSAGRNPRTLDRFDRSDRTDYPGGRNEYSQILVMSCDTLKDFAMVMQMANVPDATKEKP